MMQDFVRFTPHILTMKYKYSAEQVASQVCLSNQSYCLIPPKTAIKHNVTKEAMLLETLYGRCL
jgi:hypothetical protein